MKCGVCGEVGSEVVEGGSAEFRVGGGEFAEEGRLGVGLVGHGEVMGELRERNASKVFQIAE